MLDSTVLLLALSSPVPAIAATEQDTIPLVAMIRDEPQLAGLARLENLPDVQTSDRTENVLSRWDCAGRQFLAGSAGGALGVLGGGFVGGVIGASLSQNEEGFGALGTMLLGAGLGASIGGPILTGVFVKMASSEAYPSRGIAPAVSGSVLGAIGGIVLSSLVASSSPQDVGWGFWPGFVTVVGCSSLGSVLLDRAFAKPASVSVALWSPRPGLQGARLGLAF